MKFSKSALKKLNHHCVKESNKPYIRQVAETMVLYLGKKEVNRKIAGWASMVVFSTEIPLPFSKIYKSPLTKMPWVREYMKEMQKPELPDNLTDGAKKALYFFIALKMYKREITEKEYHFYLDIAEILRQHNNRDKITVKEIVASETASCLAFNL